MAFYKATAGFYYQFLIADTDYLVANRKKYTYSCLILQAENDKIIDKSASEKRYNNILSKDKTLDAYKGLFHEILNEPEKELVIAAILEWIDTRC